MLSASAHTLLVSLDGYVHVCGISQHFKLGLGGERVQVGVFMLIPTLSRIKSAVAGGIHSLFLDYDGTVWSCGWNGSGMLGSGDYQNRNTPARIESLPVIHSIYAGDDQSIFLDENGFVYACGNNCFFQLGHHDIQDKCMPVLIDHLPKIQSVACGSHHTIFLDIDGRVHTCGQNHTRQLGRITDVSSSPPDVIPSMPIIQAIAAGQSHSLFLDMDGIVWVCGGNVYGQLGIGSIELIQDKPGRISRLPKIKAISAGGDSSMFIDDNNNLWACGSNNLGQLGLGDTKNRDRPNMLPNLKVHAVYVGVSHTIIVDTDLLLWGCGMPKQIGSQDLVCRSPVQIPTDIQIAFSSRGSGVKSARNTK